MAQKYIYIYVALVSLLWWDVDLSPEALGNFVGA